MLLPLELADMRTPPALVRFTDSHASAAVAVARSFLGLSARYAFEPLVILPRAAREDVEWVDNAPLLLQSSENITLTLSPPEQFMPQLFPGEFEAEDEDEE